MDVKLILTSDGSHSLINTALDETYHSRHGAIQESIHVFIKSGLDFWTAKNPGKSVSIFEVGFGTGLNALLSALEADIRDVPVKYSSLEAFPVDAELAKTLNYPQLMFNSQATKMFAQLHDSVWEAWVKLNDNFQIRKIEDTLESVTIDERYDLIFFDAFAPSKQPAMWEFPVLEKVCANLNPGGSFVTYCAKGQVKRDLKALNLEVETLPGPPGKRK